MSSLTASKRVLSRVGTEVHKHRIERLIGVGGMAAVYAAAHRNGHRVAIKFLLEHHSNDADIVHLFRREAYVANQVGHPGAVAVIDDDIEEDGCPFLIMPLLEGETLRARWERKHKRLPMGEVAVLMADVLEVLEAAHTKGIIHRDIKPENLFLTSTGHVRVLDFGIARRTDGTGSASATGRMFGTPAFMPPEQALGERTSIGPHSDCWAVGATMFTLLSGEYVHKADNSGAQLAAAATRHPRSLADVVPELPASIVQCVDKALAFESAGRWQSAHEMREALLGAFEQPLGKSMSGIATDIRSALIAEWASAEAELHTNATLPPANAHGDGVRTREGSPTSSDRDPQNHSFGAPRKRARNQGEPATLAAAGITKGPVRPRSPVWAIVLVVTVSAIAGGALYGALHGRRPAPALAPVLSESKGVPVISLPIAPICNREAQSHYREALIAFQQASWELAYNALEKAVAIDAGCPETHLQLFLAANVLRPMTEVREQYRRAISFRDILGERDRVLLDAYIPLILTEPADRKEFTRRLEDAASRFPRDAQILYLAAQASRMSATDVSSVERALELSRQANDIDPKYADAWQMRGEALTYLGRSDDAMNAIRKCIEVAPGSVDCQVDHLRVMRARGQCGEVISDARGWIAKVPTSWYAYIELANGLASEGASPETVEAALQQAWNNDSGNKREQGRLYHRALLAALGGDFTKGEQLSGELINELRKSSLLFYHARAAALLVDILFEAGNKERAVAVATRFFQEKDAWTNGFWPSSEHEPFLSAILLEQHKISREQWRTFVELWETRARDGMTKRQLWAFRWGPVSHVRELALEGWTLHPDEIPSAEMSAEQRFYGSLVKMFEARLALMAGESGRAVELLEEATNSCHRLQIPFSSTRAYLWLGQAKERMGDTHGACDAYRVVLQRWGNAKPRSVTAEEARKRSQALRCQL